MTEEEMMLQEELTLQEASDAANTTTDGTTAATPQDRPQKLTALLKDIMARRSITPAQLAAALGLNPSNVTGFLQGKKNPTLSTLDRFAEALDTPAWMLLNTPAEVIADLQQMGLMPDTVPSNSVARESEAPATEGLARRPEGESQSPAQAIQSPQDAPDVADLITVNPTTGEAHRYRLIS